MKKIFTLCILFYSLCSFAQFKINVKNTNINNDYLYLLKSKEDIRNDSIINEKIIDLVEAHTLDSIITKKYQHHRLFLIGWAIHKLGYHWISVDYRRHKVVGTMKKEFSMSGKEHYTEYDVNLDLIPHLPHYMDLDWKAYLYSKKLPRRISKDQLQKPPLGSPTQLFPLN
jgi:hypothetical protein